MGTSAGKADWKLRKLAYWGSTGLSAGLFGIPGVALFAHAPHFVHDMAHLGYPDYILPLLGAWKLLGAVVIVAPRLARLKEWAYAGMVFDASGAALSRAVLGDGAFAIVLPLVIAGAVLTSWSLRPAGRTLLAPLGSNEPEGRKHDRPVSRSYD
jgi:hypothetical protein